MAAIGTDLDVARLYTGPAAGCGNDGALYGLRCLMCYHRSHYQAFALSQEARQWLRFDDDKVELVGGWAAVLAAVLAQRMQPLVLFYEAGAAAGASGQA